MQLFIVIENCTQRDYLNFGTGDYTTTKLLGVYSSKELAEEKMRSELRKEYNHKVYSIEVKMIETVIDEGINLKL